MSETRDIIPGSPIRTARRKLNLSNEKSRKKLQNRNNKRHEKAKANKSSKLSQEKNSLETGEPSKNTTNRNEIKSESKNTEPSNLSKSKISTNDIENVSVSKKIQRKILGNNSESNIKQIEENEKMSAIETKEEVIKIEHCKPDCSKLINSKKEIETNILMEKKLNDTLYDLSSVFESSFTEEIKISNQITNEDFPNKTIVNMDDTSCFIKTKKSNLDDNLNENMLLNIFKEDQIDEVEQINKAEVKTETNEPNILEKNEEKPAFIGFKTASYSKVIIPERKLENAMAIFNNISYEIDVESPSSSLSASMLTVTDTNTNLPAKPEQHISRTPNSNRKTIQNLNDEFDELDENMLSNIFKEDQIDEVEQIKKAEVKTETNEPNITEKNEGKPAFVGLKTASYSKIIIPERKLENAMAIFNNISYETDVESPSSSLSASTLTVTDTNTTLPTESGRYNLRFRKSTPNQKNRDRLSLRRKRLSDNISTPKQCGNITETLSTPDFNNFCGVTRSSTAKDLEFRDNIKRKNSKENVNQGDASKLYDLEEILNIPKHEMEIKKTSSKNQDNLSLEKKIKIEQCDDNSSNNIEIDLNETVKSVKVVKKRRLGYGCNNSVVEISNLDGKNPRRKILGNNSESNIKQIEENEKMSAIETKEEVIKIEHCKPDCSKLINSKKEIETNILMEKKLNDTLYDLSSVFESSFTEEIKISNQITNEDFPNKTIVNMDDTSCFIKTKKSNLDDNLNENMLLNIFKEDQIDEVEQINKAEVKTETNEPNILEKNEEKPAFIGFKTASYSKVIIPERKLENAMAIFNNISYEIDVESPSSSLSASMLTVTDTNTNLPAKPEQHISRTPNSNRKTIQNLNDEFDELDENMLSNIFKEDQIDEVEQIKKAEVKTETNEPNITEKNEGKPAFVGLKTASYSKIIIPERKLENAMAIFNNISYETDVESPSSSLSASTLTVTDTNTTLPTESGRYNLRFRKSTPNQKNRDRLSLRRKRLSDNISTPKQCGNITETLSTPDFNNFCGVTCSSTPKDLEFRDNIKRKNSKENVNQGDASKLYDLEEILNIPKHEVEIKKTSSKNQDNLSLEKKIKIEQCDDNSSNNIEIDLNETVKSVKVVKKRRLGYGCNNSVVEISNLDGKNPRRKILGNNSESNIKQIEENEKMSATETKEKVIKIEHCKPDCSKLCNSKKEIETNILMEKKLNDTLYDLSSVFESSFTEEIKISNQISNEDSPNKTIVNMDDTSCFIKTEKSNHKSTEVSDVESYKCDEAVLKNIYNKVFPEFQSDNNKISECTPVNFFGKAMKICNKIGHEIDTENTGNLSDIIEKNSTGKINKIPQKPSSSSLYESKLTVTNTNIIIPKETNKKCMIHDTKQIKSVSNVSNDSNCDIKADVQNCDNNVQNKDVEEVNEISNKTEKYQKSNILSSLEILRESESKKIVSINHIGSLFWKRKPFKRVSVYNFIISRRKKMNLDIISFKKQLIDDKRFSALSKLNYSNALSWKFTFSQTDYYPIMLLTNDETIIIPDNDLQIGFNQIINSFRTIINSEHFSIIRDNWIENHYRQILLKLANYEIKYPDVFLNNCCRPEIILEQLKYRYNIEFNVGRSSCLKTLIFNAKKNGRMNSLYAMVLIVSDIVTDDKNNIELFLSDKWYVVKTSYDTFMENLIIEKKVRVGMKLYIENAELINFSNDDNDDDFVMLLSKVKLRIHSNSTRRAKFNTKLGYKFLNNPLNICLDSVILHGGNIAGLNLIVDKILSLLRKDLNYHSSTPNFNSYDTVSLHNRNVWIKKEVVGGAHLVKHGEETLQIYCHDEDKKSKLRAIILIYNINDQYDEIRINTRINIKNVQLRGMRNNCLLLSL